ncbi:hypothetical protein AABB24_032588 [Solanum stoloniferum]|uniref:Uncharacterized protein n=1 Tax=Solanum stoloniferum TaxID=62892 RepID=A0ABD2RKA9_9SOLN
MGKGTKNLGSRPIQKFQNPKFFPQFGQTPFLEVLTHSERGKRDGRVGSIPMSLTSNMAPAPAPAQGHKDGACYFFGWNRINWKGTFEEENKENKVLPSIAAAFPEIRAAIVLV